MTPTAATTILLGLVASCLTNRLVAGVAVSPPRAWSLSGKGWAIHPENGPARAPEAWATANLVTAGWTPARVPGNIQADLESAHRLTPLWYGKGDDRIWEVPRTGWWYRKDLKVPGAYAGRRMTLCFEGVDPACEVWLNGRKIGEGNGMYRPFQLDVTDAVRPGKLNQLAVRIPPMPPALEDYILPADRTSALDYYGNPTAPGSFVNGIIRTRQLLKELKSPTNFGWDWGVCIWTMGIWKDVRLEASGPARVSWTRIRTELSEEYRKAEVLVDLEVNAAKPLQVRTRVRVTGSGADQQEAIDQALRFGDQVVSLRIPIQQPVLWWPNGQGAQPLYHAEVTLSDSTTGEILDSRRVRFGIREIRWRQVEGAPADFINPFQLLVNGRPVRTMGSNLLPPDLLFGRIMERGPLLLRRAREAGMTILRVWGGGVILPEEMYALADELGIMLSQELPLANSWPETDAEFLANLEKTITGILKQTRNHPSIIEWSGGNEMPWQQGTDHPALHLLERLVAEHDGRMFRATCPIQGSTHGPWVFDPGNGGDPDSYNAAYAHYDGLTTMRHGEFGTSGPANVEVWERTIPPELHGPKFDPKNPIIQRKKLLRAVFTDPLWLGLPQIERFFGPREDLPSLVRAGQFLAAEGLRYAMDAHRRRGGRIGGFTSWDFNEPWPNGAGSYMVDYDGRPLMNYDFARQALAPIALSLRHRGLLYDPNEGVKAELFLVSDSPTPASNLKWRWLARDRRGTVFAQDAGVASIQPRQVLKVASLDLVPPAITSFGPLFVELQLLDTQGEILSERIHIFAASDFNACLGGLLGSSESDRDDDPAPLAANSTSKRERPDSPLNLAFVGNGARPATASSERDEPIHKAAGINDGQYGNAHSWIGRTPRSSFQIDLGHLALVGRVKLGRDRTGQYQDRLVDEVKVETSVDGQTWRTVFEQRGITALPGFQPTRETSILLRPVQTRHLRVTVDVKNPAAGAFACVDECEVYGPSDSADEPLPRVVFPEGRKTLYRPVTRTTLEVSSSRPHPTNNEDILDLRIQNTGRMTALFLEPHPLTEYRTDLLIDNNHCFIPPGESRTIRIRAAKPGASGLTLEQCGWRLASWNAAEVVIEPSREVLLSVGRHDQMCREFAGYSDPSKARSLGTSTSEGSRPDPSNMPYLVSGNGTARFEFTLSDTRAKRPARLRLHTADQSEVGPTKVVVSVNGRRVQGSLPAGLGIHRTDPVHLAFPATVEFQVPAKALRPGRNALEVRVKGDGWFSWDALDLSAP